MSRSASNCPDNNFYGRFRLEMDTRLDLSSKGPRGDTLSQCCSEGLLPTSEKGIPERTKTELAT